MRVALIIFLVVGNFGLVGYGQLYFPNETYYNNEIDRFFLKDSANKTFYSSHLSMKPILGNRTNLDSIYYKDKKNYYWITHKIFSDNFLVFEGEDFWVAVDPVLDLEGGTDFSADSLDLLYWNTRGARVQGKFFDKVGFSTVIYENQAMVPTYVAEYIDRHGVLRPSGGSYVQENAVMPGYGRTKPFKTTGYDFAFGEGQVSIVPNEYFNIHFGNGNHFIGNGYRSLLLSDFAPNYPFAKFEGNFWKGRIQYNAIYAIHQNLYRLPAFETVESTFERKIGTYHYLDFAITPKIHLGLFEGAHWKRSDSLGTVEPNWLFLNPVIGVNAAALSGNDSSYNHILGANFSWTFWRNRLYGQVVIDNGGLGGFQLGIKSMGQFVPKLDIQIEYNTAFQDTYFADNKRYNYSHNNISLSHPLSSFFSEIILKLNYEYKEFFISNSTVNYSATSNYYYDTSAPFGQASSIIHDSKGKFLGLADSRRALINQFEFGYRFNKRYNLQAVIGWTFRNAYGDGPDTHTNYIYAGIRTRLRNKTLDF